MSHPRGCALHNSSGAVKSNLPTAGLACRTIQHKDAIISNQRSAFVEYTNMWCDTRDGEGNVLCVICVTCFELLQKASETGAT